MAVGDFSGNGLSDLAIATESPNSVVIELNEGNGQFAQPESVGLALRNTPVVADLSGDGLLDVAIVDGAGDIFFRQGLPERAGQLRAAGHRQFRPPVARHRRGRHQTKARSWPASMRMTTPSRFIRLRNGSFRLFGSLATGIEPAQIVSADLMADGAGRPGDQKRG